MKISSIGEFELIERIAAISNRVSDDLVTGISDDAAVVVGGGAFHTLIASDSLIETIHFSLDYFSYEDVGWRAMAANLSDIAAMGGSPKFAQVCISVPESGEVENIEQLYAGMTSLADKHGVIITGGDTTRSPLYLYICITVLGEVEKGNLCLRSGARPGDAVMVTGDLGSSHAGMLILRDKKRTGRKMTDLTMRHLRPEPRCREAHYLAGHFPITAMMDISDGLASELRHICKQSNCGARILANAIPIDPLTKRVAEEKKENAFDYALNGGEDFELLFTVSANHVDRIQRELRKRFALTAECIGEVTEKTDIELLLDGMTRKLSSFGFNHFG